MLISQDYGGNFGEARPRIIDEWADLLAVKLERSAEEIRAHGLDGHDFGFYNHVLINFFDGSTAKFSSAFYLVDETKNLLVIFTEHCGYYIFSANEMQVIGVSEDGWTGELWKEFAE